MKLTEKQLAFRREIDEMRLAWEREQRIKAAQVARRREAEVVTFPPRLSQQDLMRQQALLDQAWERTLAARAELERQYGRGFHRGYGED